MAAEKARFGPAVLVTAAFIGPGTVVTASIAGASFGYALLWALLFSMFSTMVLQEMAARLGIVTGRGLGENLRYLLQAKWLRWPLLMLVIAAIVVGNSAYQGGNISGAALGADALWGNSNWVVSLSHAGIVNPWALLLGLTAAVVLWFGRYRLIERCLIVLVLLMSVSFIGTMLLTRPDLPSLLSGLFIPRLPVGATLTVVALIGTTVVPYSLFLHAAAAAQKWPGEQINTQAALKLARQDIAVAIPLGALISMAIVSTAAAAFFGSEQHLESVTQLAQALTPLFGAAATWCLALGLLAAGLSSAITAPLAAAYALSGILGKPVSLTSPLFRATWLAIVVIGIALSSSGIKPVSVIWFAQIANGILLPLICLCLLLAMNHAVLGRYKNSWQQNTLGILVLLVTLLLSARSLAQALGWL